MSSSSARSSDEDIGRDGSNNNNATAEDVSPLDDPSLLMPSLCRHFALRGTCRFKDNCHYSHVLPENCADWKEACERIPCPHYQRGICRYANMCRLAHCVVIDDRATVQQKEGTPSIATSASNDTASRGAAASPEVKAMSKLSLKSDDHDPNDLCCGICLEPLGPVRNDQGEIQHIRKKFGLLSACDHIFCIQCLRTWRHKAKNQALNNGRDHFVNETSDEASKRVRACPACRQASDFVVPSDRFCTGEEKRQVLASYQARLSCTPCKRFNGKLGSCPFGSDCFYEHRDPHTGRDMKCFDKSKKELWKEKQEKKRQKEERRRSEQRRGGGLLAGMTSLEIDELQHFLYLSSMERFFSTLEDRNTGDNDSVNSGDLAYAHTQTLMDAQSNAFLD